MFAEEWNPNATEFVPSSEPVAKINNKESWMFNPFASDYIPREPETDATATVRLPDSKRPPQAYNIRGRSSTPGSVGSSKTFTPGGARAWQQNVNDIVVLSPPQKSYGSTNTKTIKDRRQHRDSTMKVAIDNNSNNKPCSDSKFHTSIEADESRQGDISSSSSSCAGSTATDISSQDPIPLLFTQKEEMHSDNNLNRYLETTETLNIELNYNNKKIEKSKQIVEDYDDHLRSDEEETTPSPEEASQKINEKVFQQSSSEKEDSLHEDDLKVREEESFETSKNLDALKNEAAERWLLRDFSSSGLRTCSAASLSDMTNGNIIQDINIKNFNSQEQQHGGGIATESTKSIKRPGALSRNSSITTGMNSPSKIMRGGMGFVSRTWSCGFDDKPKKSFPVTKPDQKMIQSLLEERKGIIGLRQFYINEPSENVKRLIQQMRVSSETIDQLQLEGFKVEYPKLGNGGSYKDLSSRDRGSWGKSRKSPSRYDSSKMDPFSRELLGKAKGGVGRPDETFTRGMKGDVIDSIVPEREREVKGWAEKARAIREDTVLSILSRKLTSSLNKITPMNDFKIVMNRLIASIVSAWLEGNSKHSLDQLCQCLASSMFDVAVEQPQNAAVYARCTLWLTELLPQVEILSYIKDSSLVKEGLDEDRRKEYLSLIDECSRHVTENGGWTDDSDRLNQIKSKLIKNGFFRQNLLDKAQHMFKLIISKPFQAPDGVDEFASNELEMAHRLRMQGLLTFLCELTQRRVLPMTVLKCVVFSMLDNHDRHGLDVLSKGIEAVADSFSGSKHEEQFMTKMKSARDFLLKEDTSDKRLPILLDLAIANSGSYRQEFKARSEEYATLRNSNAFSQLQSFFVKAASPAA